MRTLPMLLVAISTTLSVGNARADGPFVTEDDPAATPIPDKYKSYTAVVPKALKAMPEELKNKRVCVEGEFGGFTTTFPEYFERNGFKNSRYVVFSIRGSAMPVVARKNDTVNMLMLSLKSGATIRVFGKVKKFSREPRAAFLPHYYLDYTEMQVLAKNSKRAKQADRQDDGKDQQPRPKGQRRRWR